MGRSENVAIFEDTRARCRADQELALAIRESNSRQAVILEDAKIDTFTQRYSTPAKITVSKKRSCEAAHRYLGQKTCVLNFASATNPGGGVVWGSTAQEECLCRCSTLYANLTQRKLWSSFYEPHREQHNPLYNDDCIYTPDVVVFKSDTASPEILPRNEWWRVNVITCAAPNLRTDRDGTIRVTIPDAELKALHIKRMRRILSIAAAEGNEVVILGAYGCGAFKNPPEVVAAAMKQAVEEFQYCFKTIEFAVYCSPRDERNYQAFHRVLGGQHG